MRPGVASGFRDETAGVVDMPRLVGREREAAVLRAAIRQPASLVLVEGEAGIGKSRLIREALESRASGCTLTAACPPLRGPLTLAPVVEALRHARPSIAGRTLGPLAGSLRPFFPEWAAELPEPPEPAEDAVAARHRVFRALADLLRVLGTDLLVVEDLHWADEATAEFLIFLSAGPDPLRIVASFRAEELAPDSPVRRLGTRSAHRNAQRITLRLLTVAETADLASSMLADEQVSTEFAAFLHAHTDGLPLAVEETVRLMHDRADLSLRHGEWVRRQLAQILVPPTIRDAVLERVARLDQSTQLVVRAAAVFADPVDEATLRELTELRVEQVRSALTIAVGSGLLSDDRPGRVGFRHILSGRAVYESVPTPERSELHRRSADALAVTSPSALTRRARHYRESGQVDDWARCTEQAADLAIESGDEATAVALLHDVLTNAELPAPAVVRLMKKFSFASLTGQHRYEDLVGALQRVIRTQPLRRSEEAEVRVQLARLYGALEDHERNYAELKQAMPHLSHDPVIAARAMVGLGWPHDADMTRAENLRWLHRAGALLPKISVEDRLPILISHASALLMLGEEDGWAEARTIPDTVGTPTARRDLTLGHLNLGDDAIRWGRYAEAQDRLRQASELAERFGYIRLRDGTRVTQAHLDWFLGNWTGLAERVAALTDVSQPATRMEAKLITVLLGMCTGTVRDTQPLQDLLATLEERRAIDITAEPAAALARAHLDAGDVDEALRVTEASWAVIARKGVWIWAAELAPARVAALIADRRPDEARHDAEAFGRGVRGRDAPVSRAGLALCRAELAATGEPAAAARAFARAAAAWDLLPRPYAALLARARQAEFRIAAGDAKSGMQLLADTVAALSELGATVAAGRLGRSLETEGRRAPRRARGRPGYGDHLSPRELQVVRLLVTGLTDREIAESLYISPRTVASHLDSARQKLKAVSRTALAVKAIEAGVASGDGMNGAVGTRD